MNKRQFMASLRSLIPANEVNEILIDFEEHFATGLADGKTEEEIVEALGSPIEIAEEYGYSSEQSTWASKVSPGSRVMAGIGLVFFDLIIGIALVATLFSVWISLWSVVVSLLVGGIAAIFSGIFIIETWYIGLSGGIALLGLTVLSGIGMIYVSKYFWLVIKWYGKIHVNVFSGK